MNFYNPYFLADSRYPLRAGFSGVLVAPSIQQTLEFLKKASDWHDVYYYLKEPIYKLTDVRFSVKLETTVAYVSLVAIFTPQKVSSEHPLRELAIASVTISTVHYNCSALHISNFYSVPTRSGLGSYFLKEILKWARIARYSFIFGNTAGSQNMQAYPFFIKNGFIPLGEEYVNPRSLSTNKWIQYRVPQETI